ALPVWVRVRVPKAVEPLSPLSVPVKVPLKPPAVLGSPPMGAGWAAARVGVGTMGVVPAGGMTWTVGAGGKGAVVLVRRVNQPRAIRMEAAAQAMSRVNTRNRAISCF